LNANIDYNVSRLAIFIKNNSKFTHKIIEYNKDRKKQMKGADPGGGRIWGPWPPS